MMAEDVMQVNHRHVMLWMMVTRPCHRSLAARNVVEKCIQSIIKDFTVTTIKFQM
ncbi:Hypothetical protein DPCES_4045 [Desulfitobacterium hafniense]|uniref:Uncharacterized protein n=2 Tax=Desulfitobacterium hafniense TaxID=49338 RepID=A0A098B7V8_DESHA|nr:Hypothetical protein DPCES_4045 [Desulfitobacterium hafniense]